MNKTIIDISPLIHAKIAVFPGDTPFEQKKLLDITQGAHLDLSFIKTTVHLGAHTDAPIHYHPKGQSIETRDLSYYLGPAQVVQVSCRFATRIYPKDVTAEIIAPRVLFKTQSYIDPDQWTDLFMALSPELVDFLAAKKVRLVGIDTPSVDLAEDTLLESHKAIYRHDMAILEGIVLAHVAPGLYDLISLPLKIKGADATPVRAILLG